MTHPTLGYANLRFAGDDAVHLPATPAATMTTACLTSGPHDEPLPHDVDAPISCAQCLTAVDADWWMALIENERRTGEVTSLTGTLDDVKAGMERLMTQAEAVVDETMLGGGASMVPEHQRGTDAAFIGLSDYFLEAAMERARRASVTPPPALAAPKPMQGIATGNADDMLAMARQLEADEVLARQLAASPLADLRRFQFRNDVPPGIAQEGPWRGEAPLIDPGAERVRKAIKAAQQTLKEHPFDEAGADLPDDEWSPLLSDAEVIEADRDTPVEEPYGLYYHPDRPGKAVRYNNNLVPDEATMGELSQVLCDFLTNGTSAESSTVVRYESTAELIGILNDATEQMTRDGRVPVDMPEFTHGGEAPLIDPGAERVRKAIEAAQQTLEEHPFDEKCQRCNYDTHRCLGCGTPLEHGVEVCDSCDAVQIIPEASTADEAESYSTWPRKCPTCGHYVKHAPGSEVDWEWTCTGCADCRPGKVPDFRKAETKARDDGLNWCHVHNRQAQPGREECSECDGERGEDQKAGES